MVRFYLAGNSVVCNSRLFFSTNVLLRKKDLPKPHTFIILVINLDLEVQPHHNAHSSALPDEDGTIHLRH